MAETVNVFGRKMPKTLVYAGGAAVVGIVGYAWWRQGTAPDEDEFLTEEDIDMVGDERIPPTTIPTESQFGSPPPTNAEWTQTAVERMINLGVDGSAASSAIGKFLARQPLSKSEADLARQAIAHAGFPPENGPWQIIEATTPPPKGGDGEPPTPGTIRLGRPSYAKARVVRPGRVHISIGPSPTVPSDVNVIYQARFRRQGPRGYYWKGGWRSITPRGRRTATLKMPNKGRFYLAVRSKAGSKESQTTNSNPFNHG